MVRSASITTKCEQSVIWLWFQEWGLNSAIRALLVITKNFQGCKP